MLENDRYEDIVTRLKGLPKIALSEQAEDRIIMCIQAEQTRGRRRAQQRKWVKALLLTAISVIFLFLIPDIPSYIDQLKGMFVPQKMEEDWSLSPTFDLYDHQDGRLIYPDGVRGIEGRIGFRDVNHFAATEPEPGSKMFWYVWGDPEKLVDKELIATAVHQKTGKTFTLNKTKLSGGGFYGTDAHALTQFEPFPLKGIWRIDIEIDHMPYGSIVIHVKDAYVRTDSYRFVGLSKDDLIEGVHLPLYLDGNGVRRLERIDVNAFPLKNPKAEKTFYFYDQSGSLYFDQPGKWQIELLGEKTIVEVQAAEDQWLVSPIFEITDPENIKGVKYQGIEGRIAFPAVEYIVGQKKEKMLVLLWGDVEEAWDKEIILTAEQQYTGEAIFIAKEFVREPWEGIGTHVMTSFSGFPSAGMWRIDANIEGELYDSIFVNVKRGNPSTRTGRLMKAAEQFYVGSDAVKIELYGRHFDEELIVTATFIEDPTIVKQFAYQREDVFIYDADSSDPFYTTQYNGWIHFDRAGYWEIDILGSKTAVYVKP